MIKRLNQYEHLENKELIIMMGELLGTNDTLDKASKLSLLLKRPLVHFATIEEHNGAEIAILERLLVTDSEEQNVALRSHADFLEILKDTDINSTLIKNTVSAICQSPVDAAEIFYYIGVETSEEEAENILSELEQYIPQECMTALRTEYNLLLKDDETEEE